MAQVVNAQIVKLRPSNHRRPRLARCFHRSLVRRRLGEHPGGLVGAAFQYLERGGVEIEHLATGPSGLVTLRLQDNTAPPWRYCSRRAY